MAPSGSRHLSPTPLPASDGSSGNHTPRNSPLLQDSEQTDCRTRAAERRAGRGAGNGDGAYGEPCGPGRGAPGRRIRPGAGGEASWSRSGTVAHSGSTAGRRGGLGEGQAGLGAAGVCPGYSPAKGKGKSRRVRTPSPSPTPVSDQWLSAGTGLLRSGFQTLRYLVVLVEEGLLDSC